MQKNGNTRTIFAICRLQAIRKDDRNFMFKGQKAVYNKQITTTTGLFTSEQYVKNRVSSPLSAWKKDYVDAGKPSQQPTAVRIHGTSCVYASDGPSSHQLFVFCTIPQASRRRIYSACLGWTFLQHDALVEG